VAVIKYKVVMTDTVYPDLEMEKRAFAAVGAEFVFLGTKEEAVIAEAVKDADAVIVCYAKISEATIQGMTKCRSISKTGIGVNNIDVEQATKQGIRVMNVSDYCIEEVSDVTIALILSLIRRIPFLWDNVRAGNWSWAGSEKMPRIRGKTMGFLGFGRIARRSAEKMKPFGVELIAYDPYVTQESVAELGVRMVSLDEALSQSDILSLNLPLTNETKFIINKDSLAKMKETAVLVNTARGPLINEEDLCAAVRAGKLAGVGLDVLNHEAYDADNPLFFLENVIITPHAAFWSTEATQELREKSLADLLTVLDGKEPKYMVNRV